MKGLESTYSLLRASAMRWLGAAFVALALLQSAMAQGDGANDVLQEKPRALRVQQSLFLDKSGQLDLDEVRSQSFQPFNPLSRSDIGDSVVWVRMHIELADGAAEPLPGTLFLHLLPPQMDQVTLYSPSSRAPGSWDKRVLDNRERLRKIKLGVPSQADDYYLRITSRNELAVMAFTGGDDDVDAYQRSLDVAVTAVTTLISIALAVMVWRTLRHFNWISVFITALLPIVMLRFWFGYGYAHTVLAIPIEASAVLAAPLSIAILILASVVYIIFTSELFQTQRWLRWFWFWPMLNVGLLVYSFIDPSTSVRLSNVGWRVVPAMLGIAIVFAAIRVPASLRSWPSRVAFGLMLMAGALTLVTSLQSGGVATGSATDLTASMVIANFLARISILAMIIALATWLFQRLQADRLQLLSGELQKSKESLEMESKRLARQRKFTAMLAHELKNPLAVSHIALSGIESRIGNDYSLRERASSIKHSLQDIDAIIERCSEIDGFENGELPMKIGTFSLIHFLASLKDTNTDERIYVLMRGIQDDAILTSDIHYLKIIFNNLLTNALKYSPPDTLIELSVQSVMDAGETKSLSIRVSNDVGPAGTPAPNQAFKRYYRAEAARNQSGAGLGLWLSQALAHALGSEVVMRTDGAKISFSMTLSYT
jgi:signal transduction histidine kinase